MYQSSPLLTLPVDSQTAIQCATQALTEQGLKVLPSFDLQIARHAHGDCHCPYHGTRQCNCQLVVLMVYDQAGIPVSLVAHTQDKKTRFELVDSPQQPVEPRLRDQILTALVALGKTVTRADLVANLIS